MKHPFLLLEAATILGLFIGVGGIYLALMYGPDALVSI